VKQQLKGTPKVSPWNLRVSCGVELSTTINNLYYPAIALLTTVGAAAPAAAASAALTEQVEAAAERHVEGLTMEPQGEVGGIVIILALKTW
jgi:hypothetical protein